MKINWKWQAFADFTDPGALYQALQLRQQVFIVEQGCIYADIDDQDAAALHLLGWINAPPTLAAYARLFLPQQPMTTLSFGRVVVSPTLRGMGLGKQLIGEILAYLAASTYANHSIVISAQYYLVGFYRKFGFVVVGEPYDEDGVLHVEMHKHSC